MLINLSTLLWGTLSAEDFKGRMLDYHSYAWLNDPVASDAFAWFGPPVPNLYPAVRHPVTRRLAERLSARRRRCCVEPMRKATEGVAAGGYRSGFWRGC
ncbi:hypothetical protein BDZ91DRAFT_237384 [Kalaharituber pfeilii]|nr:hypothetical protein BDZ91DRAFT_237384 [Kalaharituber pfeilii]